MWKGSVAFDLVTLPVQLFPANRTARASLRMVSGSGQPLERRYFAPDDVGLPELGDADAGLRNEAERAMKRLSADELDRSQLRDRATRRLLDLVATKRKAGEDVVDLSPESGEAPTDEVDLMQVLKRSLAQADEDDDAPTGKRERGKRGKMATRASNLEGRTKRELYERALALDIGGRSGMTKQELVEAIRAAS
jgi:non-homologous end joining protein Ku